MVEEPKPKKSGRRRVKDLNTPLTIKEKKARKSAQDLLRETNIKDTGYGQFYTLEQNQLQSVQQLWRNRYAQPK